MIGRRILPALRVMAFAVGVCALCSLQPRPTAAAETRPADLVLVKAGSLPIILTAPHGGRLAIPGVAARDAKDVAKLEASRAWGGLVTVGDAETDRLALAIAAEIEKQIGKAPYVVVAQFHRRYVDLNRPAEIALDDPGARPFYDRYHESIRRFIDDVRRTYRDGVLIDVHGEARKPELLMRGTNNGRTVSRLVRRAGADAITGPNGLFGQLEARGFAVFPDNKLPLGGTAENAGFNGGYTVATYGSHRADGIDAVQLEFGSAYRQRAEVDTHARNAARSIAAFYEAYLK